MDDPAEHALVVKAFVDGTRHCVVWNEKQARIVDHNGYNPGYVLRETRTYVRANGGGVVVQRRENRPEWRDDHSFYYMVILPLEGLTKGLFVEMRLVDDDPDLPQVQLVNAHPES